MDLLKLFHMCICMKSYWGQIRPFKPLQVRPFKFNPLQVREDSSGRLRGAEAIENKITSSDQFSKLFQKVSTQIDRN